MSDGGEREPLRASDSPDAPRAVSMQSRGERAASGFDQVLMTRIGLRIPPRLSYEEWERAGRQLSGIVDSSAWCLGDWLVYGKERYADRYQRAIRTAGLDYQTLRNYAWVARRFDVSRRRAGLSFQHHAEVASLPVVDQDRWLNLAAEAMWSTKQLRSQLRDGRGEDRADLAGRALMVRVLTGERLVRWRRAADLSGIGFDRWVVAALDMAAEQAQSG